MRTEHLLILRHKEKRKASLTIFLLLYFLRLSVYMHAYATVHHRITSVTVKTEKDRVEEEHEEKGYLCTVIGVGKRGKDREQHEELADRV
jgi:dolichol kinase